LQALRLSDFRFVVLFNSVFAGQPELEIEI